MPNSLQSLVTGTIEERKPTATERVGNAIQDLLESWGMDRYTARRVAQTVGLGGESSGLPTGGGLVDPLGGLRQYESDPEYGPATFVGPIKKVFGNVNPLAATSTPQTTVQRYAPPRGLNDRTARLLANKKARDQVGLWTVDGMTDDGLGWYNMEELKKAFVDRLGPEQGLDSFNRYIDLVAATSAGARTNSNARIASYYYVNDAGAPVPIPPAGSSYGHKAQRLHNRNANEIIMGGALQPLQHPKRFTFAENLKGNFEPVTVDKHNVRAWGMASRDPEWVAMKLEDQVGAGAPSWWDDARYGKWTPAGFNPREFVKTNNIRWESIPPTWFESAPAKTEYAAFERLNQDLAEALGLLPAQAQSALWLGAGPITGLGSPPVSMINTLEQVIANTAKKRGQDPMRVLDDFIRKRAPLVVPAGVGAGLYGAQDDDNPLEALPYK